MKNLFLIIAVSLTSIFASAGGAGAGPVIKYYDLVHCTATEANDSGIQELIYFSRGQSQFGFNSAEGGVYITGEKFSVSIYAMEGDLHPIKNAQENPAAVTVKKGDFYSIGWNVRAFDIKVQGNQLLLSMIAGATGKIIVNNLKMTCSLPN